MYTKALSVPRLTCQARVGAILTHHGHGHTTTCSLKRQQRQKTLLPYYHLHPPLRVRDARLLSPHTV